jgi:hypothetical protein
MRLTRIVCSAGDFEIQWGYVDRCVVGVGQEHWHDDRRTSPGRGQCIVKCQRPTAGRYFDARRGPVASRGVQSAFGLWLACPAAAARVGTPLGHGVQGAQPIDG